MCFFYIPGRQTDPTLELDTANYKPSLAVPIWKTEIIDAQYVRKAVQVQRECMDFFLFFLYFSRRFCQAHPLQTFRATSCDIYDKLVENYHQYFSMYGTFSAHLFNQWHYKFTVGQTRERQPL